MVAALEKQIGEGIYSPAEAAFYARIAPQTMTRWLVGNTQGKRVIRADVQDKERFVNFWEFTEALAIRSIRASNKIPLQSIREAVKNAEEKYGVKYPFARKHMTYYSGGAIHINLKNDIVQVSGKEVGQTSLRPIVEVYLEDLSFDDEGLAASYRAYSWKDLDVVLNPKQRFGEPIVSSCGYTARVLWEACKSEGSIDAAASSYGIKRDEADVAFRYYDHLQMAA